MADRLAEVVLRNRPFEQCSNRLFLIVATKNIERCHAVPQSSVVGSQPGL